MFRSAQYYCLSLFLAAFVAATGAFAQDASLTCSFQPSLEKIVEEKLISQKRFLDSIESILDKDKKGIIPTSALFSIDLKDEEAVQKRIKELTSVTEKSILESSPYAKWQQCAPTSPEIKKSVTLQLLINQKKLELLKKPKDERNSLISLFETNLAQSAQYEKLDNEQTLAEQSKQKAAERLEIAENTAAQNIGQLEKDIAGSKSVVEKYVLELENNQLDFIKYKVEQTQKYGLISSELTQLASMDISASDARRVHSTYLQSAEIWRELVDHIFDLYLSNKFLKTPDAPKFKFYQGQLSESTEQEKKAIESYDASIQSANKRQIEINSDRIEYIQKEKEMISSLLLQAGQVRSNLFQRCRKMDCADLFAIDENLLLDIIREVKIVPFKLFALGISKSVEAKRKIELGLKGWVDIAIQIAFLTFLLILPFVFLFLLRWISKKIDSFRRNLINRSMLNYRYRTKVALWISRLNPFLPWIGMLFFTRFAKNILMNTDVRELGELAFYLSLYFWYRISLMVIGSLFEVLFPKKNLQNLDEAKIKIQKSSTMIARILFLEIAILHATSNAVREAYVYTIFSNLITYINAILLLIVAKSWKEEIYELAEGALPGKLYAVLLREKNKFISLIIVPILLVVVLIHFIAKSVYASLSRFDFIKWINSEVFKQRLQKSVLTQDEKKLTVPHEYLKYFDFRSPISEEGFIRSANSHEKEILSIIQNWKNGVSEDDAIILQGNRGLGKSTLVQKIGRELKDVDVHYNLISPKSITSKELYAMLSKMFGHEFHSTDDFVSFDKSLKKKRVVFLDDAQNFFLSKINGLGAYRELQEIVNLQTENIFWGIVFNSRSWNYLKGVFGSEHFYGKVFEMKSWTDSEIQQLILSRHEKTGFKKRFDESIKAFGDDEASLGSQAEVQFFRLLWGQSRGNPRSALVYWLTALKSDVASNSVRIGVPKFLPSDLVSGLSDEALFILAAITKHENLSQTEIIDVTEIADSVAKKCLKQCEGRELIWKDAYDRFRITPRAQYFVDFFLLGKNFIHE
jgi:hypothetical protein